MGFSRSIERKSKDFSLIKCSKAEISGAPPLRISPGTPDF
jgi:hypothetical protein